MMDAREYLEWMLAGKCVGVCTRCGLLCHQANEGGIVQCNDCGHLMFHHGGVGYPFRDLSPALAASLQAEAMEDVRRWLEPFQHKFWG